MAYYSTSASYGTTGVKTITCGFAPVAMRITVGAKSGSTAAGQLSVGSADGTRQVYDSVFSDTTGSQSKSGINKIISHWERVSGTLTEKVAGTFDSFTATEGKFNITTADNNYSVHVELWD